jgi:aconitate hydratase
VIAESYERIHRANLVGMGVLPLQYGKQAQAEATRLKIPVREHLGLTGRETFDIIGLDDNLLPMRDMTVVATGENGQKIEFQVICRVDTPVEVEYYRHGGILHRVLRQMLKGAVD